MSTLFRTDTYRYGFTFKPTALVGVIGIFFVFILLSLNIFFFVQTIFPKSPFATEKILHPEEPVAELPALSPVAAQELDPREFPKQVVTMSKKADTGLSLYRQDATRARVLWFYTHITGSENIARSILEAADKNDIPLALAFSVAYVESRYKPRAVNRNRNNSIDRGLFQLNNRTFTALSEEDFFDPHTNARNGLAHLRFCLDTAGNEITALAMYNAGTTKVKKGETPKMTLDYVSHVTAYRESLDALFAQEVAAKAETPTADAMYVASLK